MRIINDLNLPEPILRFAEITLSGYDRGESDITISELWKPPQIVRLERAHWDKLTVNLSDLLHLLDGQCVHHILEKSGNGGIREKRFYVEILGWKVGGKIDYLDLEKGTLTDYKRTSAWSWKGALAGEKEEWARQLNSYSYLLSKNGIEVKELQICGLFRDWRKKEARQYEDYPRKQAQVMSIERWEDRRIYAEMEERVALHRDASTPACRPDEMWEKPTTYAVLEEGRKTARRVLLTESEAIAWIESHPEYKNLSIEVRDGERTRCEDYCNVGKNTGLCPQFVAWKKKEDPLKEFRESFY